MTAFRFTRSGGLLAAPGLMVRARVELFEDGSGTVASDPGYRRRLPCDEGLKLLAAIAEVGSGDGSPRTDTGGRDEYQYEFEIDPTDGKRRRIAVGGARRSAGASGVSSLVEWAGLEADAIIAAQFA